MFHNHRELVSQCSINVSQFSKNYIKNGSHSQINWFTITQEMFHNLIHITSQFVRITLTNFFIDDLWSILSVFCSQFCWNKQFNSSKLNTVIYTSAIVNAWGRRKQSMYVNSSTCVLRVCFRHYTRFCECLCDLLLILVCCSIRSC